MKREIKFFYKEFIVTKDLNISINNRWYTIKALSITQNLRDPGTSIISIDFLKRMRL